MKHYNIPIFIPELACPNRCIYCNQRHISGQLEAVPTEKVVKIIEEHLSTFKYPCEVEVAFFGGNFTGIEMELQKSYLDVVQPYIKNGRVGSIRISTRPDYINDDILEQLKKYNVGTIELGAQSLSDKVLEFAERGHGVKDVENASKKITDKGFDLGLQMMIGLPLDTIEQSKATARKIMALGAKCTRIYPALVINHTKLADMYERGEYEALTIEQAVDWTAQIYKMFIEGGVTVLRVGLHPSEDLINGKELLAGPFHVSFKELVLTRLWNEKLRNIPLNVKEIIVNPKDINYAVGYNSKNKKELMSKIGNIRFSTDHTVKRDDFRLLLH